MAHMHEDPREFFLVIDASGVTWKASLEEGLCTQARTHSLIETLPDCAYLGHRHRPTSPSVKKFLGSVMGD